MEGNLVEGGSRSGVSARTGTSTTFRPQAGTGILAWERPAYNTTLMSGPLPTYPAAPIPKVRA